MRRKAAKQIIIEPIKKRFKMKKGIHPENYRLVAFKDMSNEDVFITKSTVETKKLLLTKVLSIQFSKWRFLERLTLFTQVNLNLLILQDVSINSTANTLKKLNNFRFFKIIRKLHIL